ncbi:MAG: hypothetical protein M3418_05275 [Gemmatimonadota bacterium]|nr:hypothetical protein [Gemmatimonadota bacterium]
MTQDQATRLIKAQRKLHELGLHPEYAELHLEKNLHRITEVGVHPEHVAMEIYNAAPAKWKGGAAEEGADGHGDGESEETRVASQSAVDRRIAQNLARSAGSNPLIQTR